VPLIVAALVVVAFWLMVELPFADCATPTVPPYRPVTAPPVDRMVVLFAVS
jgi:hypothetical protein